MTSYDEPTLPTDPQLLERLTQSQLDGLISLHERFIDGRIGGRRAVLKRVDISGLTISYKNMRGADFSGCLMRNMNLANTSFQEAVIYACDLSFSNLSNVSFIRADLRGTRIESANLVGADLEKADLRGGALTANGEYAKPQPVNFRGANMEGARMVGSMANNADFSDAIMTNMNFQGADLRGARMMGADLTGADLKGVKLDGADFHSAILTGSNIELHKNPEIDFSQAITDKNVGPSVNDLSVPLLKQIEDHQTWVETSGKEGRQLNLTGYDLRELGTLKTQKLTALRAPFAKFFGMNLFRAELQSAYLEGADFRRCDLGEADFRGSVLKGARFSHASMHGINFMPLLFVAGATQRFAATDLSRAIFRYADLREAHMKSSVLTYADLSYANLTGCDLRDCDFTGAKMEGTILDGADTTGANFGEVVSGKAFSLKSLKSDD